MLLVNNSLLPFIFEFYMRRSRHTVTFSKCAIASARFCEVANCGILSTKTFLRAIPDEVGPDE